MSQNTQLSIKDLSLDLKNFRTTPQTTEIAAIKAMISIKPDKFFGLMDSILEDGYLHTENLILLEVGTEKIVKEGNRRAACLKLIHQIYDIDDFNLTAATIKRIKALSPQWLKENSKVSCIVYKISEQATADKIVSLTHAKGEKAGRDKWTSVATARHNRDYNKKPEPVLDLLEKYLIHGQNLSLQQKDRWAGEYNLTVLVEAISKIHTRLEVANATDLALKYPKIKYKSELEELMRDIGLEDLSFTKIRDTQKDFAQVYGINPLPVPATPVQAPAQPAAASNSTPAATAVLPTATVQSTPSSAATPAAVVPAAVPAALIPKSIASNDPRHVAKLLKSFVPRGNNRSKVVTLRNELQKLKLSQNPIAFCFILRSMFEISVKAYFVDHSLSPTKSNGKEKTLAEMLTEATNHLTGNNSNIAKVKILHGAVLNITTPDRLLSVTSMNHLVHNPNFSFISNDICVLFGNIYPLLEALN